MILAVVSFAGASLNLLYAKEITYKLSVVFVLGFGLLLFQLTNWKFGTDLPCPCAIGIARQLGLGVYSASLLVKSLICFFLISGILFAIIMAGRRSANCEQ